MVMLKIETSLSPEVVDLLMDMNEVAQGAKVTDVATAATELLMVAIVAATPDKVSALRLMRKHMEAMQRILQEDDAVLRHVIHGDRINYNA